MGSSHFFADGRSETFYSVGCARKLKGWLSLKMSRWRKKVGTTQSAKYPTIFFSNLYSLKFGGSMVWSYTSFVFERLWKLWYCGMFGRERRNESVCVTKRGRGTQKQSLRAVTILPMTLFNRRGPVTGRRNCAAGSIFAWTGPELSLETFWGRLLKEHCHWNSVSLSIVCFALDLNQTLHFFFISSGPWFLTRKG